MKPVQFTWIFYLRLGIVSFGLLVAAPGIYPWIHGNSWFTVFNPRFGQFGTGPTVMMVFFGLIIVLFGLFSNGWEGISPLIGNGLSMTGGGAPGLEGARESRRDSATS